MSDLKNCIEFAANVISSGHPTTRRFDGCFEWWGSSAVAVALYRRTQKRPETKLAQNLYKYLSQDLVEDDAAKYADWDDLESLCDHLEETGA